MMMVSYNGMLLPFENTQNRKVVHNENDFGNDMIGAIKISQIGL